MHSEVNAAINLIAASLYNKLPRRRVDAFCDEIEKGIFIKIQGNWHPDNPSKGAAYRCIHVSGDKLDPLFVYAAMNSGLEMEEVSIYLPKEFVIWINPGEVSFTMGEKSQVKVLYSAAKVTNATTASSGAALTDSVATNSLPQQPPISLNSCPTAITSGSSAMSSPLSSPDELTSTLSSSFGSLSLSSGGSNSNGGITSSWTAIPSPVPWSTTTSATADPWTPMSTQKTVSFPWNSDSSYNAAASAAVPPPPTFQLGLPQVTRPTNNNKTMTAAMFAQTKFGSTKLKSHSKRSNRLSPTENFNRPAIQAPGSSYQGGSNRHQPTMNPVFLDRMQMHMNNNNLGEFPIDHFKMAATSSMNKNVAPGRPHAMPMSNNPVSVQSGAIGGYTQCNASSNLAGMFSSDQDWIDLSDMTLSSTGGGNSGGNPLLAA